MSFAWKKERDSPKELESPASLEERAGSIGLVLIYQILGESVTSNTTKVSSFSAGRKPCQIQVSRYATHAKKHDTAADRAKLAAKTIEKMSV